MEKLNLNARGRAVFAVLESIAEVVVMLSLLAAGAAVLALLV